MTPAITTLLADLERAGYIAEPATATALFLAQATGKPLLVEGDAGVGKTELAKVLAQLLGTELIRLQCYEGLDVQTALYEWDYARQMLHVRIADAGDRDALEARIFSRDYLLERPLLRAITHQGGPAVLLIDEIDRADDGFEAFLLELLADFQVTIPEIGTIKATHPPHVLLTSNRTRELGDALRRRCLYLYLDHPTLEREVRIIEARCPAARRPLPEQIARFLAGLRSRRLVKPPGIAETLDFTRALIHLGQDALDPEVVSQALGCLLKDRHDLETVTPSEIETLVAGAGLTPTGTTPPLSRALALARLGGALRAEGVPTTLRDELDAADVLPLVDSGDRDEQRATLRIALKVPRAAWEAFDRLFASVWLGEGARAPEQPAPGRPPRRPPPPITAPPVPPRPLAWDPVTRRMGAADAEAQAPGGRADAGNPAWSPAAILRRKPFDSAAWSPQDLAAMERLLAQLARRLATRRSRRWVASPASGRGRVDPRRSFRRALATSGEVVRFARRARAIEEPRLVFLCDTSGSMEAHARFLLSFVLALRRAARRAELFAFNTELVRITPAISPGRIGVRPGAALERIAAAVPDWAGGTRLGDCLAAFAADHLARLCDRRTTVVILSDGLDRGEPAVLEEALRQIRRRARKIIWLNPLLGDERYEPLARGMRAALPFIDHLAPAHDLASLERLIPHLTA